MNNNNHLHPRTHRTPTRLALALCTALAVSLTAQAGLPPVSGGLVAQYDAQAITGLTNGATVNTWNDSSGAGNNATRTAGAPTYQTDVLNGNPVVRFAVSNAANFSFPRRTDIRTIFWVLLETNTTALHFLMGDSSTYDFHREYDGAAPWPVWDNLYSSANIRNGTTRFNGTAVNGTATVLPTGWNLLDIVTSGNISASTITRDRTYGREWEGDIAEILIYNKALSVGEVALVEGYLNSKWFTPVTQTAIPIISPAAGTYAGPGIATLTCATAGATIYYTIDGWVTTNTYSSPIPVPAGATTTLQAYSYLAGRTDSAVVSAAYTTTATTSGVWTNLVGGSWTDSANWQGSVIPSGGAASFGTLSLPADMQVTLDGARSLASLVFGDVGAAHNWTLNTGTGDPLTLATWPNVTPAITVNNQTATLGVALAGTQGLTKTGAGTLTLTGGNIYTGTTALDGGRITATDPAIASHRSGVAIATGATFEASVAADLSATNSFNFTGTGTLIKTGAGKWLIGNVGRVGISLAAGGLVDIREGAIGTGSHQQSISGNQGSMNIEAGATLDLAAENATMDALTGSGTIDNSYPPSGMRTVTLGVANGSGTFSGVIGSTVLALAKTGTGTQVLGGDNTYSGSTTVNGGTLVVQGSIAGGATTITAATLEANGTLLSTAAVLVQTNGTLRGAGVINGPVTVRSGGTLAPGTTGIGTLTIYNTLTNEPGSRTILRVSKTGGAATNDQVVLSSVGYGGTLVVTNVTSDATPLALSDKFTLFAAPVFAGSFSTIVLPALPAGLSWDLTRLSVDGSIAVANQVVAPVITPPGGGYATALSVTISSMTSASTIRYTTDGTDPVTSGTATSAANPVSGIVIPLYTNLTLRACATSPGMVTSTTVSAGYQTWPTGIWTNTAGGAWSVANNWTNGVIGYGIGVTADFATLALPGDTHVSLDEPRTIGHLVFGDLALTNTWYVDPGTFDPLTLDAAANTPSITVNNQAATLTVALAGTNGLIKAGSGKLVLTGANTFTGASTNSAGLLQITDLYSYRSSTHIAPGATVDANVPFDISAPNAFELTGTGTLVKTGLGKWLLGDVGRVGISLGAGGLVDIQEGIISTGNHKQSWTSNQASLHIATGATVDLPAENLWVDALTGGGDIMNSYAPSGGRTVFVGVANGSGTFGGTIGSGNLLALTKSGTGTQTLTGFHTYTGATIVSNGVLRVDGSLDAGSTVAVRTNGTLSGTGTIGGPTSVAGTLAPGASIGTLTFGGSLTLSGNVVIEVDKALAQSNDVVNVIGTLTYGGILTATNIGAAPLVVGDSFPVFLAGGTGTFAVAGSPGPGLAWSFNPSSGVLNVVTGIATDPTNITYSVSGGQLTLSWPAEHTGWMLQTQTNALSVGITGTWHDVAGSTATNQVTFPVDATQPAVFYRLVLP